MDLAGHKPTLAELAKLFGKSSRWLAELRANGAMPPDGATLTDNLASWVKHQNAATGQGKGKDAATTRLMVAQADMAEMKNAQMRLELLPRGEVNAAVQSAFARVRAKMLALPTRAAPIVVSMSTATAVQEKITELVHEALAELSNTQVVVAESEADAGTTDGPADGGGKPGDAPCGEGLVAGDDAAAKADRKPVGRRKPVPKSGRQRRAGKMGHKPG